MSFFRRIFGSDRDEEEIRKAERQLMLEQEQEKAASIDDIQQFRLMPRANLAELRVAYYSSYKATVDVEMLTAENNDALLLRLVLEYYAETLFRLGDSDAAVQLQQYVAALCLHLFAEARVQRYNILGTQMELLSDPPPASPIHDQKLTLVQNEDGSLESDFSTPMLPTEFYLPSSILLVIQNMLYTMADDRFTSLLMAISAMNAFYTTRYRYNEIEGRRLAVHHALQQLERHAVEG